MRKGLVSFLNVIESEGESGDENAQLDLDSAGMKPAKKAGKAAAAKAKPAEPASAQAGPRRAARGGRREDQGPQLLHRHGHPLAEGVPRQPVPGGGRPRLRRELAPRQDDRALPLRQPRPAPVPARRLRHHRGHRAHRLAQLPAEPAQGLAARGTDGAARPHRLGLGAVHQRVQGGGGPLPGDHRRRSSSRPRSAAASSPPSSASARPPTTRRSGAASSSSTSRRSPRRSARSRAASPVPIKREFLEVAHKVTAAEMKEEEKAHGARGARGQGEGASALRGGGGVAPCARTPAPGRRTRSRRRRRPRSRSSPRAC